MDSFQCPHQALGTTYQHHRCSIDHFLPSSPIPLFPVIRHLFLPTKQSAAWAVAVAVKMSKAQSVNGSESEFEFIETPKAPTPKFEKFEDCGVRTTSVSLLLIATDRRTIWSIGLF